MGTVTSQVNGSVRTEVDGVKSCINLNDDFGGGGICLEARRVKKKAEGEPLPWTGEGGGKMICANFTIENIVNKGTNITIVPFGANGRTKLDFENLEDEEVIAEQCVSVNQLPLAVVANPGLGFFATDGEVDANLAYADKVAFLFTEGYVTASILGEVSFGGFSKPLIWGHGERTTTINTRTSLFRRHKAKRNARH